MRRLLALLFCLACGYWYVRQTIVLETPGLIDTQCDFRVYHQAARNVVAGHSPYRTEDYIYPPLLAFLVTPLAPVDYVTARRIWFGISQLILIAAAVLLWRGFGRDWIAACSIALVWAVGGSAEEALGMGQLAPFLTFLLVLSYLQRARLQGFAIALGFALKLIPGILGLGLLARRDRKAVLTAIAGAALLLAVPWLVVAGFFTGPKSPPASTAWTGTPALLSWSIPSSVLRILDPAHQGPTLPRSWTAGPDLSHETLPPARRRLSVGIALATLAAGCLWLFRAVRYRLNDGQLPWAMAALVSLALAASPVGWTHYQMMQYPGVAMLLTIVWRTRRWLRLAVSLLFAAMLYPLPVAVLTSYYERYNGWTAASPATLYFWTSVTPIACLGIFVLLVQEAAAPSWHRLKK